MALPYAVPAPDDDQGKLPYSVPAPDDKGGLPYAVPAPDDAPSGLQMAASHGNPDAPTTPVVASHVSRRADLARAPFSLMGGVIDTAKIAGNIARAGGDALSSITEPGDIPDPVKGFAHMVGQGASEMGQALNRYVDKTNQQSQDFVTKHGSDPESSLSKGSVETGKLFGGLAKYTAAGPYALQLMSLESGSGKAADALDRGYSIPQAVEAGAMSAGMAASLGAMPNGDKAYKTVMGLMAAKAAGALKIGTYFGVGDAAIDKLVFDKSMSKEEFEKTLLQQVKTAAFYEFAPTVYKDGRFGGEARDIKDAQRISKNYSDPTLAAYGEGKAQDEASSKLLTHMEENGLSAKDVFAGKTDTNALKKAQGLLKNVRQAGHGVQAVDYAQRAGMKWTGEAPGAQPDSINADIANPPEVPPGKPGPELPPVLKAGGTQANYAALTAMRKQFPGESDEVLQKRMAAMQGQGEPFIGDELHAPGNDQSSVPTDPENQPVAADVDQMPSKPAPDAPLKSRDDLPPAIQSRLDADTRIAAGKVQTDINGARSVYDPLVAMKAAMEEQAKRQAYSQGVHNPTKMQKAADLILSQNPAYQNILTHIDMAAKDMDESMTRSGSERQGMAQSIAKRYGISVDEAASLMKNTDLSQSPSLPTKGPNTSGPKPTVRIKGEPPVTLSDPAAIDALQKETEAHQDRVKELQSKPMTTAERASAIKESADQLLAAKRDAIEKEKQSAVPQPSAGEVGQLPGGAEGAGTENLGGVQPGVEGTVPAGTPGSAQGSQSEVPALPETGKPLPPEAQAPALTVGDTVTSPTGAKFTVTAEGKDGTLTLNGPSGAQWEGSAEEVARRFKPLSAGDANQLARTGTLETNPSDIKMVNSGIDPFREVGKLLGMDPDASKMEVLREVGSRIKTLGKSVAETTMKIMQQFKGMSERAATRMAQVLHGNMDQRGNVTKQGESAIRLIAGRAAMSPDSFGRIYESIPESHGGTVFSYDIFSENTLGKFGVDGHDRRNEILGDGVQSKILKNYESYVDSKLQQLPEGTRVHIVTGPVAAGKTSLVREIKAADPKAIIMEEPIESAKDGAGLLHSLMDMGLKPSLHVATGHPDETIKGSIRRGQDMGRYVPPSAQAAYHQIPGYVADIYDPARQGEFGKIQQEVPLHTRDANSQGMTRASGEDAYNLLREHERTVNDLGGYQGIKQRAIDEHAKAAESEGDILHRQALGKHGEVQPGGKSNAGYSLPEGRGENSGIQGSGQTEAQGLKPGREGERGTLDLSGITGGADLLRSAKEKMGLDADASDWELIKTVGSKIGGIGKSIADTTLRVMQQLKGIGRDVAGKIAEALHSINENVTGFGLGRKGQHGGIGDYDTWVPPKLSDLNKKDETPATSPEDKYAVKPMEEMPPEKHGVARDTFAPSTAGKQAQRTADIVSGGAAAIALNASQRSYQLNDAAKIIDKMAPEEQRGLYNVLEGPRADVKHSNPVVQKALGYMRDYLDRQFQQMKDRGIAPNYIEDYFPHMWKDTKQASAVMSQYVHAPLEGTKGHLKERTIPTVQDGINMGLTPLYDNPLDMFKANTLDRDKYIYAHEMFDSMKESGVVQLAPRGKIPQGMAKLDDKIATSKANGAEGTYVAPQGVANVFNNYLSRGFSGNMKKPYEALRSAANNLNAAQLGLSGFHFLFVSHDSAVLQISRGLQQMVQDGDIAKGAGTMSDALLPVWNQVKQYRQGKAIRDALRTGEYPEDLKWVSEWLKRGGMRSDQDMEYQLSMAKNLGASIAAINDSSTSNVDYAKALAKTTYQAPLALVEKIAKPLMEDYVPTMKLAAYFSTLKDSIERAERGGNVLTEAQKDRMARSIGDSIENRMGQLAYDNLHWHKLTKQIAMLSTRSVGWNVGTQREQWGALKDTLGAARDVAPGGRTVEDYQDAGQFGAHPAVSMRMTNQAAALALTAIMGSLTTWLMTGDDPSKQNVKDYFMPRTGGTDTKGHPNRIVFPTYMKDQIDTADIVKNMAQGNFRPAADYAGSKVSPLLKVPAQMAQNSDWKGNQIVDENSGLGQHAADYGKFAAQQVLPLSIKKTSSTLAEGDPVKAALSMVGIMPPKASQANSAAENLASKYISDSMPKSRSRESADKSEAVATAVAAYSNGNTDQLMNMRRTGEVTQPEFQKIMKGLHTQDYLVGMASHLTGEELMNVFEKGTPEEQKRLLPMASPKVIKYIQSLPIKDRASAMSNWKQMISDYHNQ